MRRPLSIALVLLFWLAPLVALLPGNEDARLPSCCRRHGAHHCAMSSGTATVAPGRHAVGAPAQCPLFRIAAPATLAALPQTFLPVAGLVAQRIAPVFHELHPCHSRVLTQTDRGPPTAC